jgi:hypothetical protein
MFYSPMQNGILNAAVSKQVRFRIMLLRHTNEGVSSISVDTEKGAKPRSDEATISINQQGIVEIGMMPTRDQNVRPYINREIGQVMLNVTICVLVQNPIVESANRE